MDQKPRRPVIRQAQCPYCKTIVVSDPGLAFFEDRSVETDRTSCGVGKCYYVRAVHNPINPHTGRPGVTDHAFVPRVYIYDSYYCGCRGWD